MTFATKFYVHHLTFIKMIFVLTLFMMLIPSLRLSAQHRDTIYIFETQVVYDTIVSRDTVFLHDTIRLHNDVGHENAADELNGEEHTFPAKADTTALTVQATAPEETLSQQRDSDNHYDYPGDPVKPNQRTEFKGLPPMTEQP